MVCRKITKKAQKQFLGGKVVKNGRKVLKIIACDSNFLLRIEWSQLEVRSMLRCRDMVSRIENGQNLAICQTSKFYTKKHFHGFIFVLESIFDALEVR